jgi:hypothetical protein
VKQICKIAALVLLLGLLMSGQTLAEHCRITPRRCVSANDDQTHSNVPVKILRDYLVIVEGHFGDGHVRNFILDTGTAPSIVNARLVKKLGLAPFASTMSMIGKIVPAQMAVLPELNVGPVRGVSVRVQIQDLAPVERDLGISLAGIVGMDVLGQSDFRLDYEKKMLVFGDALGEGIPVPFDARRAIAVASVQINGNPRRMLVDTGTDHVALLGIKLKHSEGIELHSTSQQGSNLSEKRVPVQALYGPDIVLGDRHFTVKKAYLVSGNSEPNFDGLLGVRALGFRAIIYNREHEAIYLQK